MERPEVPLEQVAGGDCPSRPPRHGEMDTGRGFDRRIPGCAGGNHLSDGRASRQRSHARPDSQLG